MTTPTGTARNLPIWLSFPLSNEATTPNNPTVYSDTIEWWPSADSDEIVDVGLRLSLNEYVALATCVDIGRDIAYGDNSEYLWWLWTRAIRENTNPVSSGLAIRLSAQVGTVINNNDAPIAFATPASMAYTFNNIPNAFNPTTPTRINIVGGSNVLVSLWGSARFNTATGGIHRLKIRKNGQDEIGETLVRSNAVITFNVVATDEAQDGDYYELMISSSTSTSMLAVAGISPLFGLNVI